jgi:DNA-binding NtrC family response regulator
MAHANIKTVEILALKSALTPCILDENRAQLETLAALVEELGYESILTSDPQEALKCVRYSRSRLLLADPGVHGYEFLDKALRTDSIQIRIPSLAERLEDIPLLVRFFLKKYNEAYGKKIPGLTRRAQAVLLQHLCPGNVRDLENVISSACITATGDFIDLADWPEHLQHRGPRRAQGDQWRPLSLNEVRKVHIQRVLDMCHGNRLRAAQTLEIGRTSLYRYLKRDGQECEEPEKSGRCDRRPKPAMSFR